MENIFIIIVAQAILLLIPAWRIFGRAGFEPVIALVVLVPYFGWLIGMGILAFVDWPAARGAGGGSAGEA